LRENEWSIFILATPGHQRVSSDPSSPCLALACLPNRISVFLKDVCTISAFAISHFAVGLFTISEFNIGNPAMDVRLSLASEQLATLP